MKGTVTAAARETARLTALALIVESRVRLPDASGHLDTDVAPSQAPDRREMVALLLEDQACSATRLMPIIRDGRGGFTGFDDSGPVVFGEGEGRFAKLMPRHKPGSAGVERAKQHLRLLGMSGEPGLRPVAELIMNPMNPGEESIVVVFRNEQVRQRKLGHFLEGFGPSELPEGDDLRAIMGSLYPQSRETLRALTRKGLSAVHHRRAIARIKTTGDFSSIGGLTTLVVSTV